MMSRGININGFAITGDNVVTKFRALWESLAEKEKEQLWDILTALRGSDAGSNDDVKYATTARIRGEFLGERYSRGYTFTTFREAKASIKGWLDYPSGYSSSRVVNHFRSKPFHFKAHIRKAIKALNCYRPKSAMRDLQKFLNRSRD
jgi:hypothetical protein